MKIAEVEYTGRVSHQRHRGPSGERYSFGKAGPTGVTSVEDAQHFEGKPNFEVEYTARGKLLNLLESDKEDLSEAIGEIDYNVKRSIASQLDVETDSREESVLEEALVDQAESLRNHMENQR